MIASMVLALALVAPAQREDFAVRVDQRDGEWWCSASATRASVDELLRAIALRTGVEIEGLANVPADATLTVELRERPLAQVLARILGSVGLSADVRGHAIRVAPLDAGSMTVEELREQSVAAYLRALREFPEHPAAANARLAQAEIERARGNDDAALAHFEGVIQRHRESEVLPDALLGCGELLVAHREWAQAAQRFTDLLRLDRRHPFEIRARLQLARCTAELGDHERTFYMLDVVETYAPTLEPSEIQERLVIRARALLAAQRADEALATLDQIEKLGARPELERELFELRARALDAIGLESLAAQAWISAAQRSSGRERVEAFAQAARNALDAGDTVAALFIAKCARQDGDGDQARWIEQAVRADLALEPLDEGGAPSRDGGRPTSEGDADALGRAERLIAAGFGAEARAIVEPLFAERASGDEDRQVRLAIAYARSLDAQGQLEAAIRTLQGVLTEIESDAARRRIYVAVGELYEAHDRLDDAVLAYQGRL